MLDDKTLITLKQKGLRTLDQFMLIDYFVTVKHMIGYLEAQTGIQGKENLAKIRHQLVWVTAEIFAEKAQPKS